MAASLDIHILEQGPSSFAEHGLIPISYIVSSRLDLEALRSGSVEEVPVKPFTKNYDDCVEDRPEELGNHHDVSKWVLIVAFSGDERVGGAIVAWASGHPILENRMDLASIVDIRVRPELRGMGIGSAVFRGVVRWAASKGCAELRIETQDVNAGACRFYRAMGCTVHSIREGFYGPEIDEAQLIWSLALGNPY